MFALIDTAGNIIQVPSNWSLSLLLESLYIQGCTMVDGGLRGPGGEALALPDAEPTQALTLAGLRILPVVVLPANPPEGQMVTGQEDVLLEDRVERRPIYGEAPTATEVTANTTMSVTALFERFTDAELVAARELAKTDAVVDLFWIRLLGASVVDLAYPPVVSGVRYLVGKLPGFDAARADAVLGVSSEG
ncbi:hypothetical protein DSECCO2_591890 [anaerobic digester metagenome]